MVFVNSVVLGGYAGRLRTAALVWRAEAGIVVVMVVRRDVIGTITGMIYVISQ